MKTGGGHVPKNSFLAKAAILTHSQGGPADARIGRTGGFIGNKVDTATKPAFLVLVNDSFSSIHLRLPCLCSLVYTLPSLVPERFG